MKVAYSCVALAVIVAFSGAKAVAQAPQKDAPSYSDTVHYIQERLSDGLEEKSHCHFVDYESGPGSSDKHSKFFDVAELSPHVSWENRRGEINCAGAAKCIHSPDSESRRVEDSWSFFIKSDTDKPKMEKALLHLLDLCGVRPAKPDLF